MGNTVGMSVDSESVTLRLQGGWTCLICDLTLSSVEQMNEHCSGIRHAHQIAYIQARGESYRDYVMWQALLPRIPVYPSKFPTVSKPSIQLSPTITLCSSTINPNVEKPPTIETCESKVQENKSKEKANEVALSVPTDSASFFECHYCKIIPIGQYFCEPCLKLCPSIEIYGEHISSFEHMASLSSFSRLEVDYFQPFIDRGRIFFIGLVSKSVVTDPMFFERKHAVLMLQWKLAGRIPSGGSQIMQTSPESIKAILDRKPDSFQMLV